MFQKFKRDIWLSNLIIRRPNLQNNFKLFIKIFFPPGLQDRGLESWEAVVSMTSKHKTYWTDDPARLPVQLAVQGGQRHWNSVQWGNKYFALGWLEQPRLNKNLLYRHDESNKQTKEGPLLLVFFESPFTSVSIVSFDDRTDSHPYIGHSLVHRLPDFSGISTDYSKL